MINSQIVTLIDKKNLKIVHIDTRNENIGGRPFLYVVKPLEESWICVQYDTEISCGFYSNPYDALKEASKKMDVKEIEAVKLWSSGNIYSPFFINKKGEIALITSDTKKAKETVDKANLYSGKGNANLFNS